jgi:hypothetical protein
MKTQISSWATWVFFRIQILSAGLDPDILQWPGGIVIALILWFYAEARPFWSVGAGCSAGLRGSP